MGNSETRGVFDSGNGRLSGKLLEIPNLPSDFVPAEGKHEDVLFPPRSSLLLPDPEGKVKLLLDTIFYYKKNLNSLIVTESLVKMSLKRVSSHSFG